jgi:hypothetical protein
MAGSRAACPNEVCTCGCPAVKVFVRPSGQETGYCGFPDRSGTAGPCPLCGFARHAGPCPEYQVKAPDGWAR